MRTRKRIAHPAEDKERLLNRIREKLADIVNRYPK